MMAGLIGFALVSCDDTSDLGVMQKNEAPVVVPADGVALKSRFSYDGANAIDLQKYEGEEIPLLDIALSTDFPESATVSGVVEVSDNAEFNNAQTLNLTTLEAETNTEVAAAIAGATRSLTAYVNCEEWETAFTKFYGLDPNAQVNFMRYKLFLTYGNQNNILYYDGKEWWPAMLFNVTPLDAKLDVAASYTLYYTIGGQEYSKVMYHNPDNHVYDDPVFNTTVEVTENGDESVDVLEWWLAPTDDASRTFGVTGDDPAVLKGSLAEMSEGAIHGQIDQAGTFKIEVNMLDLTYSVMLAPPALYVVSPTGGITFDNAVQLGTTDFVEYRGMVGVLGNWALTGQAAYSPTVYINNPDIAQTTGDNGTIFGGLRYQAGTVIDANCVPVKNNGLFYITADLASLGYTMYRCSSLGFCGTINDWGATNDETLKGSRTTQYLEWTGNITVEEGSEWKIRANNDWVVNFGGANGGSYTTDGSKIELSMDGDNFVATEAGTFTVTVYLKRVLGTDGKMTPYYMTVTPAE